MSLDISSGTAPLDNAFCTYGQVRPSQSPVSLAPAWIEIEEGVEGGYLLIHVYLREGPFLHTWNASVEEAMAEAKEEFSIREGEWESIT